MTVNMESQSPFIQSCARTIQEPWETKADNIITTVEKTHTRKSSSTPAFTITWSEEDLDKEIEKLDSWKPGRGEWLILGCLTEMSLVVALDATIVVPVLPTIASSLHGTTTDTFWVGSSYLLTSAVFQPLIVALSDDFGRRLLLFLCALFFTIGTLVCCLSNSFTQLLVGRSIQGIGGGGIMAMNNVIISDIIPLHHRPMYLAVPQIAWAVGTITGPLIGGLFVEHATWQWVFYINFPFCAIGLAIISFTVKLFAERPSVKERLMRMDWVGMFLFITSTTSFLIGITWGGVQYEWYSWQTLVPLLLGLFGLYLTCMWEIFVAPNPFLRFSLFNNRSANAAYIGSLLQGLLLFCALYYLPIYFEAVKGFGPAQTGLALIPATGALVPISIVSGAIMRRLGKFRWAIWSGWAVTTLATGLMILLDVDIQNYGWILILIATGIGYGGLLMSLNYCIQVWADSKEVAHAAVMYTFLRSCGICLGVTLGGTVFQNQLIAHLREMSLPADIAADAISLITNLSRNPAKDIIAGIISKSFHNVAEFMLGCAVFGGLLSLMIKSASTDKALESEHVLRTPSPDVDSLSRVEKGEFE